MTAQSSRALSLALLCSSLAVLPGCGLWDSITGSKSCDSCEMHQSAGHSAHADDTGVADGSPVLVSINGKARITEKMLNATWDQMIKANPQIAQLAAIMPNFKQNVLEGMINDELVMEWGRINHIEDTADFKKELAEAMKMYAKALVGKQFATSVKTDVSSSDVRNWYNENKNRPPVLLQPAGLVTKVARFDALAKAEEFYTKTRQTPADFEKLATQEGLSLDAQVIDPKSDESDETLRNALKGVKAPSVVGPVKVTDKVVLVLYVEKEQAAEYTPLDKISEDIKRYLEQEKLTQAMQDKVQQLRKEYTLDINKEFFEDVTKENDKGAAKAA